MYHLKVTDEDMEEEEDVLSRVLGNSEESETTHFTAHVPVPSQKQVLQCW